MLMKERSRDTLAAAAALALLVGGGFALRSYMGSRQALPAAEGTYMGHYGFVFRISPESAQRLRIFGAFSNPEKTSEVVFVFPRDMQDDQPFSMSEDLYEKADILRMEVNPNKNFPPGVDVLQAAKYAIGATLKGKNEAFSMQDIAEPMPGFVVDIATPTNLRQVFLKGEKVHYLLTAAPDNPVLGEVLSSLAEVAPTDEPGK